MQRRNVLSALALAPSALLAQSAPVRTSVVQVLDPEQPVIAYPVINDRNVPATVLSLMIQQGIQLKIEFAGPKGFKLITVAGITLPNGFVIGYKNANGIYTMAAGNVETQRYSPMTSLLVRGADADTYANWIRPPGD
ncbi:MAG TPA: hypothetical protein VEA59_02405 [Patescibacteria group bacterium]|nr:hypothetical protein [Patescibacteria group bacterium]